MDNFFHDCPPMMSDGGRQFGDFKTATRRNEYIKYINDIWRDDRYRLFLQQNGGQILDKEWQYHKENNSCHEGGCIHNYPTRSTNQQYAQEKAAYDSVYDKRTNSELAPLRQCRKQKDFRLFPDKCV